MAPIPELIRWEDGMRRGSSETEWRAFQVREVMAACEPSVEEHVRYLAGRLDSNLSELLETRLTRSANSRARHVRILALMEAVQKSPVAKVHTLAARSGLEAEVAQVCLRLIRETISESPNVRPSWLASGWRGIRDQLGRGASHAETAWTAFQEFAGQVRLGLALSPVAMVRGERTRSGVTAGLLDDARVEVEEIEATPAGSLTVSARVCDASGRPDYSCSGRKVSLGLEYNGEFWPLGLVGVEGDRILWSDPDLARAMHLPQGLLPAEWLRALPEQEQPTATGSARVILAPLVSADGMLERREARKVEIVLVEGRNGALVVETHINPVVLEAFRDRTLRLDLVLSESSRQMLGEWPLADWGSDTRTVTIDNAANLASPNDVLALMSATLVAPASHR